MEFALEKRRKTRVPPLGYDVPTTYFSSKPYSAPQKRLDQLTFKLTAGKGIPVEIGGWMTTALRMTRAR